MKKILLIILCLVFLISCSSPSQRRETAKEVSKGEIVFQSNSGKHDVASVIVLENKNCVCVVHISRVNTVVEAMEFCYNNETKRFRKDRIFISN